MNSNRTAAALKGDRNLLGIGCLAVAPDVVVIFLRVDGEGEGVARGVVAVWAGAPHLSIVLPAYLCPAEGEIVGAGYGGLAAVVVP